MPSIGNFQMQTNLRRRAKGDDEPRKRRRPSEPRATNEPPPRSKSGSRCGAGGKASISRSPRGKSSFVAMEFQQAPGEKTTLTLGTGDHRQVFQAADLWRLAIVQPKECQENLFPLLDMLRPDWKLGDDGWRASKPICWPAPTRIRRPDHTRWAEAGRSNWATTNSPSARRPIEPCERAVPLP